MKYPNHIILDVKSSPILPSNHYWVNSYQTLTNKNLLDVNLLLNYSSLKNSLNLLPFSSLQIVSTFHQSQSFKTTANTVSQASSLTWSLFNINFLRKEKIYTKLKYSRCPQYDMVSGGVAALFAAFLGFLITEKFGLELLDSGDFYIAFMYAVFICFSVRPFLRILSTDNCTHSIISLKFLIQFTLDLFVLFFNTVLFYWSKLFVSESNNRGILFRFFLQNQFLSSSYTSFVSFVEFLKTWPKEKE